MEVAECRVTLDLEILGWNYLLTVTTGYSGVTSVSQRDEIGPCIHVSLGVQSKNIDLRRIVWPN
jgi:hypothetical protein